MGVMVSKRGMIDKLSNSLQHESYTVSHSLVHELIEVGRRLDQRGWVPGGGGNFSARVDDNRFLITASGCHKGRLNERDFLFVDANGNPESSGRHPSAEVLLHCERLNALPAVRCVLHGHSTTATVLGRLHRNDTIKLSGYEMLKGLGGIMSHDECVEIPIFDNDQDIERLADLVTQRHREEPIRHGYVIRGHGVYAWGDSVEVAASQLESLEFLLECHLLETQRG